MAYILWWRDTTEVDNYQLHISYAVELSAWPLFIENEREKERYNMVCGKKPQIHMPLTTSMPKED